jgi:hypothetical protein
MNAGAAAAASERSERHAPSTRDERPVASWTGETLRQAEGSVMRNERVRLQPYVDAPLAKQLAAYSAATGKTTSFVVQAALRQYLDRTDDKVLLLGQIAGLRRACDHTQRDLEIHMEAFAIYVKLWFAYTPHIPDNAKDSARRTAESRFAQYQEYVIEQFQGGRRFVDDLPREVIADETELSRMANEAPAAPAGGEAASGTDEE